MKKLLALILAALLCLGLCACGKTAPAPETETAAEVDLRNDPPEAPAQPLPKKTVWCLNINGEGVGGVLLSICDDETCTMVTSESDGSAVIEGEAEWHVTVRSVPDGYKCPEEEFVLHGDELMIMFTQEEPAAAHEAAEEEVEETAEETLFRVKFSTVDYEGNAVDESITAGKKVIMVNFFESWCGPCVGEMSDLERLYEDYKDSGLLLLGVYTESSDMAEIARLAKDKGITYPLILRASGLKHYAYNAVPTTYFFDAEANRLSKEPFVGSRDYNSWKSIIEGYLE